MKDSPLLKLQDFGQSFWMDFIRRGMLVSGELQQLIQEDGLRGMTSNPSIFEKAISGSHDYDKAIRALALEDRDPRAIYQALTLEDIRRAADLFRSLYDRLQGRDGFVSLEVSPHLAHDTAGTVAEARQLWKALARPNAMVKVPATREGLAAIQQLTCEGLNINVTLLFALPRYREVAEAYIAGLEERADRGLPLQGLASVASFFLSRIDVLVDAKLEKIMQAGGSKAQTAQDLRGQVAIASAKVAYQMFREIYGSERFRKLSARGARPQRLLWASTSTKNPSYSDVKYVEPLIGAETINTMALETINAYRNHGQPASRLEEGVAEAYQILDRLGEVEIDLTAITQQLEEEGVHKFIVSFDTLMSALEAQRAKALKEPLDRQALHLGQYASAVQQRIQNLEQQQFGVGLWRKDPRLWKREPVSQKGIVDALGWLHVAEKMEENLDDLLHFAAEVRAAGFRHVVHMGIGGSSLAPLTLQHLFPLSPEGLPLTVLDTTDPATILKIEREVPLGETLFIVASKSGTTAEPLAFGEYFYGQLKTIRGDRAGENFVAITDPEAPLARLAKERRFRKTFLGFPDIGGRYSALSPFGLVPAALMGLNVAEMLVRALRMEHACASCVPVPENPGVVLGAVLGELARLGRNKATLLMPDSLASLGLWLEQLLAESTGKEGTGVLPAAGEPLGPPSVYGADRVFIHVRLDDEVDERLEKAVSELREEGQPVIGIQMDDRLDIAQEFFRWEIATATVGAILGINPFDQPNVQESKENTNRLLEEVRRTGKLIEPPPTLIEGGLRFYGVEGGRNAGDLIKSFLSQARPGDYLALQAYLPEAPATLRPLQKIQKELRDRLRLACTLGYGPRFLHSTGQFHKGGPNTGLFLQLTADVTEDAPIPGAPYTFGVFRQAQALGDLEALRKHGRRVLGVRLGGNILQGLEDFSRVMEKALGGNKP